MTNVSIAASLQEPFPGHSEMAGIMRSFNWSATELGPPQSWPANLCSAVRICLTSRFPILIWWGPQLKVIYNDAYLPFLSERKRTRSLMQPGRIVWSEIWDPIGPMLAGVMDTGVATWSEDFEFFFDRKLPQEEVFVSFSYGPIFSADGQKVEGVFCPCAENTEKVISARRLETLRRLGACSTNARELVAACQEAAAVLRENRRDIPFAAIYVGGELEFQHVAGVMPDGRNGLPASLSRTDVRSHWPLARALHSRKALECSDLEAMGVRIPGAWPELTRQALVLPIRAAQRELAGLLVVGVSPRRPLDAAYRSFFDLVAGHIASAISNAQAYEAERKRAEALAEIDRAKTAFFSNVSHEFRTPITLILGPLEDELNENPRERIQLAHRNALRLLKLVNVLLDFSRIEAGRMQARYEPADLPAITAELAGMFRAAMERAGLALVVDCPPMQERVFVDHDMWEKIVLNLLSNAFKFTFEGRIEVSVKRKAASAELCVSDTGTGIAPQELPRIFERFHRIRGARGRSIEGSGIGLALIQELVKLHVGAVNVESVEGHGSRFTVSIPLGYSHLPADRLAASTAERVTSNQASSYVEEALRWLDNSDAAGSDLPEVGIDESRREHRPRILFADDNADMRRYVERILSPRYELNVTMDGEAALIVAQQYLPELVLADVMMPRLGGFELLRSLRADARTRDVPVILLSARAGEEARVEGLERGAADYLVKPFSARELLARIDARLEIARLHRANVAREQRLRTAAEQSEARMHDELVAEIAAMSRLHELSTRWLTDMEWEALLEDMLDSTIQLVKADFGNLQLCDAESGTLRIVAQRGFTQEILDYFNLAEQGTAAWGLALQRRTRVTVENVLTDPCFARHLHVVTAAAFQSMQSTPLISRRGEVLGVLSTHFREPRQLSARELRLLDLYARQAAELIERRQAEERLRWSEERFRRYFELGLIGGALTSPDKCCLEVNDEFCRILGYEREELLRKNWAEMTHPDDLAADIEQFERVMASEIDGYRLDKRWIRRDGTIVDSIMAARAVRREDGSIDYLVGLVLDITARKRAEETLQRLQSDLEHVWRIATVGEMASWIAHELTQPLAATIANANACACWLANEPQNVQEANAAVTRIVRDATRASQVIARIRALVTRREMERTPFHIGEVIGETVGIAEVEIRRHGVSLSCKVAPHLRQAVGDRVHVQQVILNLLRNAVEAMEPVLDRARLLVITADALADESLRVAVRDSGTGLPPQERERVFDAFHSNKPAGMGMGLAISRSIVEAHGGLLWVTDNDGPGVTFQFTLPSVEAPELAVPQTT